MTSIAYHTRNGIANGAQSVHEHVFGKSITDPCLGWEKTEQLIFDIADKL